MLNTSQRKKIVLLGSTGSIGTQTVDVVEQHSEEFEIIALACGERVDDMLVQAHKHNVRHLTCADPKRLKSKELPDGAHIYDSADALEILAALPEADIIVNALVGAAGLRASYRALRAGKVLALANKESLVVGGDLLMPLSTHETLLPIDSEHGAIYQCLLGEDHDAVACLWVTASGGPFYGKTRADLTGITPAQALAHPTWNMGAKISIDSSTLMNKGLEVIEAHHLFEMPYDQINVVVQRQSAIHSMVQFKDGSVIAHLGTTDMRIPIQFALSYPHRLAAPVEPLDFRELGTLEFGRADEETFRCLALAREAGRAGGTLPCVLNAANEIAVDAFLHERCAYLDIARIVEATLEAHHGERVTSLEQLAQIDAWARAYASECIHN